MKEYEVRITPYAREQMAAIRDYIACVLLNPRAAGSLLREMREQVMGLAHMPQRFRTVDEEPWGSRGVRKLSVRNFFIYFWVDEAASAVHIAAVAYGRRDQKTVLDAADMPEKS
ncbi:MAG: type II toxin-antitoxin system RelE/ParE family toxin [Oscillospiraceae bacterium]|nr:type II toxin-antitoxin system RelE/ParE family toxin [Oscillospiraceae bacterium]